MKLASSHLRIGVIISMFFAQCHQRESKADDSELLIVHIPKRVLPGCRSAQEMDIVIRNLRPGSKAKLKLVFASAENDLASPEAIKIRRGSVYFHAKIGYLRLDSHGVYSNPDGKKEVKLDTPFQGISILFDRMTTNAKWVDSKLKILPMNFEEDGKSVGYITVTLSEDFQGDLTGWQSCHGI